ncbi:unnamed protein product, partial [Amoebophrya sp. A25]
EEISAEEECALVDAFGGEGGTSFSIGCSSCSREGTSKTSSQSPGSVLPSSGVATRGAVVFSDRPLQRATRTPN